MLGRTHKRLFTRASRALGENNVESAVAKVKAIIGPANIPNSEVLAQAAFDKLHAGKVPDNQEIVALEIVIRLMRPVVYSRRGGQLDDLTEEGGRNLYPADLVDLWNGFRRKIGEVVNGVGIIEQGGAHVGTGFLVRGGLLATNRHVLAALTYGSEVFGREKPRVTFKREFDEVDSSQHSATILRVSAIHRTLDLVLLALSRNKWPTVELSTASAREAERVVVIGYPSEDRQNNPLFLSGVFGEGFGKRRAALGEVLDGSETPNLFHDCSTTRGTSGSPVFSLETGRVVGIHRSGFFMYRNEAIDVTELSAFISSARR